MKRGGTASTIDVESSSAKGEMLPIPDGFCNVATWTATTHAQRREVMKLYMLGGRRCKKEEDKRRRDAEAGRRTMDGSEQPTPGEEGHGGEPAPAMAAERK